MVVDAKRANELQQRLVQFGARTSRVAKMLPRTEEGRYICQQLLRSGLATPRNHAEARAAESRADFLHKIRIALKELNKTKKWFEQIVANGLFSRDKMVAIWRKTKNCAGLSRHLSRPCAAPVQFETSVFGI
jgi:four helix bundle protein